MCLPALHDVQKILQEKSLNSSTCNVRGWVKVPTYTGFGQMQTRYKTGPNIAREGIQCHLQTSCKSRTHPSSSSCTGELNALLAAQPHPWSSLHQIDQPVAACIPIHWRMKWLFANVKKPSSPFTSASNPFASLVILLFAASCFSLTWGSKEISTAKLLASSKSFFTPAW